MMHEGGYAKFHLWQNGVSLGNAGDFEYGLGSGVDGSATYFHGQGSRTLILRMEEGDFLHLYADDISFAIDDLVMCISMAAFD